MPLGSQIELPERYRVTRHIASGGMSSVWEAEDQLLERVVAIKVLGPPFAFDEAGRERFQREARTAAQVSDQPHIVTLYDVGEHAEQAYIVMEHFGGGTVADRMRDARAVGAMLPRDTVLRWLREAAAGLDVAHAAGIVHRDVKPGNLLLDDRDRLAVGDFGIARLADDTQMTQTGQVLGTAAYISPEQALGRPATPASDRYALAVVAYELLTGVRPFPGGPPTAQARQHVEAEPQPASLVAPDLPPAVDPVLARGLAKEPSDRPTTATAFVDELECALGPQPPAAVEPTQPMAAATSTSARGGRERPMAPLVALAVAALVLGGIGVAARPGGDDPFSGANGDDIAAQARQGAREQDRASSREQRSSQRATKAQTSTPPSGAGSRDDPVTLDARGFGLIRQGRYAEAVPLERRAVEAFRARGDRSSANYAYALYNLGTALNRSGRPAEAIPFLQERLAISDDRRAVVEQELRDAQQAIGATDRPDKGKGHGKKPKRHGGEDDG